MQKRNTLLFAEGVPEILQASAEVSMRFQRDVI